MQTRGSSMSYGYDDEDDIGLELDEFVSEVADEAVGELTGGGRFRFVLIFILLLIIGAVGAIVVFLPKEDESPSAAAETEIATDAVDSPATALTSLAPTLTVVPTFSPEQLSDIGDWLVRAQGVTVAYRGQLSGETLGCADIASQAAYVIPPLPEVIDINDTDEINEIATIVEGIYTKMQEADRRVSAFCGEFESRSNVDWPPNVSPLSQIDAALTEISDLQTSLALQGN